MSVAGREIILASESPRRRELFFLITPNFRAVSPDVDESAVSLSGSADARAAALARLKAEKVFADNPGGIVIGCDTVVEIGGDVLGKPRDRAQARAMLAALSGRRHNVYTGVCVLAAGVDRAFCCRTSVEFCPVSRDDIERYTATEEPYDKAGAYGVQGMAACFVRGIRGDFFNVMGLPVSRLYNALRELGCL